MSTAHQSGTNAPTQDRNPYHPPHNSPETSPTSSLIPQTSTPAPETSIFAPIPTRSYGHQSQVLNLAPSSPTTAIEFDRTPRDTVAEINHYANQASSSSHSHSHSHLRTTTAERLAHLSDMRSRRHIREGSERNEGSLRRARKKRTALRRDDRTLEAARGGGRPRASPSADALADSLSALSTRESERTVRADGDIRRGNREDWNAARARQMRDAEASVQSGAGEGMDGVVVGQGGPESGGMIPDAQRTDSPLSMEEGGDSPNFPAAPPPSEED